MAYTAADVPSYQSAREREKPLPSTAEILAGGEKLLAGNVEREAYKPQFGPQGAIASRPEYTGKRDVPQQYYGSPEDVMQSETIRNTATAPFATRAAVQNARLQDGRKLNLEYGDDTYGKTNITGTSSLPSGKVNVFSGSSAIRTPEQAANEAARVAEGQKVADMYKRLAAEKDGQAAGAGAVRGPYIDRSGKVQYDDTPIAKPGESRVQVIGGGDTIGGMMQAGIARREARADKELGSRERLAGMQTGSAEKIAGMREAGEGSRFATTSGLEREKLAALQPGYAAEARLREAQTGLTGAQAETAGYALESAKRTSAAQKVLDNPQKYSPEQVAGAKAFLDKALQDKIAFEQAKARAKYEAENASYADGGAVEGYQEGGRINYFDSSKVGEKLKSAASALIPSWLKPTPAPTPAPTPIATAPEQDPSKGMWELTPEEQAALPKYADGGAIGRDPRLAKFGDDMIQSPAPQINPALAKYGQYLQAASQSGVTPVPFDQYSSLLEKTQGAMQQTPSRFAEGGAIPVAGKMLEGPGTETSDSIPAVIDGHRPAALSTGEFVIPAHIVRAKGTEFFDKLLAQYADKGEKDGE